MRFTLALSALLPAFVAAQSCPSATSVYSNLPGFPAYRNTASGGCTPGGYYQAQDLGRTSPSDAQTRCEAYCSANSANCAAFVAELRQAADQPQLYSGTCFYYPSAAIPTGPRKCADQPTLLLGEKRTYNFATDPNNCGACGKKCASPAGCSGGTCYTLTACSLNSNCPGGCGCYSYRQAPPAGYCISNSTPYGANCQTDADCGQGLRCHGQGGMGSCDVNDDLRFCGVQSNPMRLKRSPELQPLSKRAEINSNVAYKCSITPGGCPS